ncbi:MAG: GDYXXLXY domain-containing protein [Deltaproteobacteria bacterium]|nr:GDYXXLXY domain-containing protein [Deltaproteobacteria bacterium]
MNKKTITTGLAIIIVLQMTVLASEYVGAMYPLWTGEEIRLKVIPVDPRSLFRGNYARLNYEVSSIEGKDLREKKELRSGEIVYVKLKRGADGLCVFDGASLNKPGSTPFIRGRIQGKHSRRNRETYDVRYGIEAYFAPKKKALALEKELRGGGVALIMIAGNGKATLKDVITTRNEVSE